MHKTKGRFLGRARYALRFIFRFIILIRWRFVVSRSFHVAKKGRLERDRCFQQFTSQTNSAAALQFPRSEPVYASRPPLISNLQNVTVNRPVSPFLLITRVSALIASRPVQRVRSPLIDPSNPKKLNETCSCSKIQQLNFVFRHTEFLFLCNLWFLFLIEMKRYIKK